MVINKSICAFDESLDMVIERRVANHFTCIVLYYLCKMINDGCVDDARGFDYRTYFPALAKESTTKMTKTPKKQYKMSSSVTFPVFSSCCSSSILII